MKFTWILFLVCKDLTESHTSQMLQRILLDMLTMVSTVHISWESLREILESLQQVTKDLRLHPWLLHQEPPLALCLEAMKVLWNWCRNQEKLEWKSSPTAQLESAPADTANDTNHLFCIIWTILEKNFLCMGVKADLLTMKIQWSWTTDNSKLGIFS